LLDLFVLEKAGVKKILPDPLETINAALSGLFAISAGCNSVDNSDALIIGLVSALLFVAGSRIIKRFKVDDPCQSAITHGVSGLWGLISVGIFDSKKGLIASGDTYLISIQLIGSLSIIFWSGFLSFCFFYVLNKLKRLRVPRVYEIIGIDLIYHSSIIDIEGAQNLNQVVTD
jgi:Amt family ammonium transporter